MAKITIEFDTSDHEQNLELKRFMKSLDMASAIFELKYNFRKNIENYIETVDDDTVDKFDIMNIIIDKMMVELEDIDTDEILE